MKLVDSSFVLPAGRVLLALGSTRLLVEQGEVRSIESSGSVIAEATPENGVGWVELYDRFWPVYCLSDDLLPLPLCLPERKLCVVLGLGGGLFGIQCDEARILDAFGAEFYPLPACMRLADSPVLGIAGDDDGIVCISSAPMLGSVLGATRVIEQAGLHPLATGAS